MRKDQAEPTHDELMEIISRAISKSSTDKPAPYRIAVAIAKRYALSRRPETDQAEAPKADAEEWRLRWDEERRRADSLMETLDKYQQATPVPAQAEAPKAVRQFRTRGCSDWYDGLPDHEDGGGPYETRTLYTAPVPAQAVADEEAHQEFRLQNDREWRAKLDAVKADLAASVKEHAATLAELVIARAALAKAQAVAAPVTDAMAKDPATILWCAKVVRELGSSGSPGSLAAALERHAAALSPTPQE